MAVLNPSFEDAGALPGQAEHWTLVAVTSAERIAGFGPAPHEAWEGFERWYALLDGLDDVVTVLAFFDALTEGREDFDEGWANDLFLVEMPPAQLVTAPFGGGAVEDMEDGWDNVLYATVWEDVAGLAGLFDGEPREDFEEQWRSNQAFIWAWELAAGVIAAFDGGADTNEDFDNGWTAATTI
jgi:hypothetical protein